MPIVEMNDIRTAVMLRLNERFPNIKRYGEEIRKGFEEPCFFVKMLSASQTQELGTRYIRTHSFDIHYFPRDRSNEEAHEVAEKLYDVLELIEYDGVLYRGTGMNHEIVDGVLHFFVDYSFRVRREVPEPPKMGSLEQEGSLK
mgnify:CR=1 FL=1